MLKLDRKRGQKVYVGPKKIISVEVCDVDFKTGNVTLGFEAPKDIDIYRAEVYERKEMKENIFQQLCGSSKAVLHEETED